jgi:hypothetical protein
MGNSDAKEFKKKTGVTDPVAALSSGPINFSFIGWAYVDIHEDCCPIADEVIY